MTLAIPSKPQRRPINKQDKQTKGFLDYVSFIFNFLYLIPDLVITVFAGIYSGSSLLPLVVVLTLCKFIDRITGVFKFFSADNNAVWTQNTYNLPPKHKWLLWFVGIAVLGSSLSLYFTKHGSILSLAQQIGLTSWAPPIPNIVVGFAVLLGVWVVLDALTHANQAIGYFSWVLRKKFTPKKQHIATLKLTGKEHKNYLTKMTAETQSELKRALSNQTESMRKAIAKYDSLEEKIAALGDLTAYPYLNFINNRRQDKDTLDIVSGIKCLAMVDRNLLTPSSKQASVNQDALLNLVVAQQDISLSSEKLNAHFDTLSVDGLIRLEVSPQKSLQPTVDPKKPAVFYGTFVHAIYLSKSEFEKLQRRERYQNPRDITLPKVDVYLEYHENGAKHAVPVYQHQPTKKPTTSQAWLNGFQQLIDNFWWKMTIGFISCGFDVVITCVSGIWKWPYLGGLVVACALFGFVETMVYNYQFYCGDQTKERASTVAMSLVNKKRTAAPLIKTLIIGVLTLISALAKFITKYFPVYALVSAIHLPHTFCVIFAATFACLIVARNIFNGIRGVSFFYQSLLGHETEQIQKSLEQQQNKPTSATQILATQQAANADGNTADTAGSGPEQNSSDTKQDQEPVPHKDAKAGLR